jgi:hypothetical protein
MPEENHHTSQDMITGVTTPEFLILRIDILINQKKDQASIPTSLCVGTMQAMIHALEVVTTMTIMVTVIMVVILLLTGQGPVKLKGSEMPGMESLRMLDAVLVIAIIIALDTN